MMIRKPVLIPSAALAALIMAGGQAEASSACNAIMAGLWNGQATLGASLGKAGVFESSESVIFTYAGGTNPNGSQGFDFGSVQFTGALSPVGTTDWSNLPPIWTGVDCLQFSAEYTRSAIAAGTANRYLSIRHRGAQCYRLA
jgi:hypothetical protein